MTSGVATRPAREHDPLAGSADELDSREQVVDELERGRPGAIELVREPGIGKTRLLRELATRRPPLECFEPGPMPEPRKVKRAHGPARPSKMKQEEEPTL